MTDTVIDRATEDARQANGDLSIRDDNEDSELDLASNLSSSTELEADIKHEEEEIVRRSKRSNKTQSNY